MICPGLVEQPVRRCRKCARWASLPLQAKHQPNTCKACVAAYMRDHRAKNREYVRAWERKNTYGPDADLDVLMARQGNRCGICRTDSPPGRGWCIDHDHETGKVRGVLCHFCNVGLGNFRDDPDRLTAAIEWLKGAVA